MSKRPPLGTTSKLALAGKRNRVRQLLDCKQRERDHRDLKKKPLFRWLPPVRKVNWATKSPKVASV